MFLSFESQEARRDFGSSAFIELEYCKLKPGTKIRKILALRSIPNWQNEGLYVYVDDIECFYSNYAKIFGNGILGNNAAGQMDIYGINYYSPTQLKDIICKVELQKPLDYAVILEWLKKGISYNGFYLLGI